MEQEIQQKIDSRTKPLGSLGKLEEVAFQICKIQQTLSPELHQPTLLTFAADHGLAEEGVSPCPKEITYQMVLNFINGGAAINVFCKQNGLKLKVIDAGVDFNFDKNLDLIHAKIARGTKNILKEPAMSASICKKAMEKAKELVEIEAKSGCNIIGFGEMGIGNTSSAALLMHKITGYPIEDCTGRGAGHDKAGLNHKIKVLKKAASLYNPKTPFDILATFGGLEIAMMCASILEAKQQNMIILIDGFIATAAFLVAHAMNEKIIENAIFCHTSEEKGHKLMHEYLGVEGLLNLNMRLGEGSGAAVALPIITSAILFLNEMASFEGAGVSTND